MIASTFRAFLRSFPKFKLYTDMLLSRVSHLKTTNSRKYSNENTYTNNKPNLSA
jgi:hypothetical protein